MFYVKVADGIVIDRTVFAEPMPLDWPDYASWHQNDVAQIGWSFDGTAFHPPPLPPSFSNRLIMGDSIRDIITIGI